MIGSTSTTSDTNESDKPVKNEVLEVEGLSVSFRNRNGITKVTDDVSFKVRANRTLALVGESGSGKSVTSKAILGLLPPRSSLVTGSVLFDGQEILGATDEKLSTIRGAEISMIFQEPLTSLNPAYTIGNQMVEVIRRHHPGLTKGDSQRRAIELLSRVGIANAERRLRSYPHEFSGGMLQRVMIATALSCEPRVLIADEPTTALDVTIQAQILDLVKTVSQEMDLAVIWITHDMGVVADIADDVVVMYTGQVVEQATVDDLFESPRHPYTAGLLRSMPQSMRGGSRKSIPGTPPTPTNLPAGCRFAPRCAYATEPCCSSTVPLEQHSNGKVRCCRHRELGDLLISDSMH